MTNQDEAEMLRQGLIERRAYEIYQERGGQDGFDQDDWEQAEREIDGLTAGSDSVPGDEDEEAPEEARG